MEWIDRLNQTVKDRGCTTVRNSNESVLCLTCYLGSGNYAPQYNRNGIMKKIINQAISDARAKGYLHVEAYPHPEIVSVLKNVDIPA